MQRSEVVARLVGKASWDELGGFGSAVKAGDPSATFVSQLLPLPVAAVLLFTLASREGRVLELALTWGIAVVVLQLIWIVALRRDRIPSPTFLQSYLTGTITVVAVVLPLVWMVVQAIVLMNLALVAATGRRRATGFQLICALIVGWFGITVAGIEIVHPWIYVAMLPVTLGTALSFVTSHVGSQAREIGSSLAAAGATAWDISADGEVLSLLGAPLGGVEPGVGLAVLIHPDDERPTEARPGSVFEYRLPVRDGSDWGWFRETVEAGVSAGGVLRSTVSDITAEREAAALTQHLAFVDPLTGRPNRTSHLEESKRWAAEARGHLFMIDLDRFKQVNDSVGHAVGDQVLRLVAERFAAVEGIAQIARLGGDEFAALVDQDAERSEAVAERLLGCMTTPLSIDGLVVSVGASVGIARFAAGLDADEVRRRADVALALAKTRRGQLVVHDPAMELVNERRIELAKRLPSALGSGEFIVFHQPKIDVATRKTIGTEALVRWRHPDEGIVMPADFLDLVGVGGHLTTLTSVVIRAALADLATARAIGHDWTVAINIDGRNLREPNLVDVILCELEVTGLRPEHLIVELTEEALVGQDRVVAQTLDELAEAGCRLSVDDFGTGFSSLAYLGRLPVSEIKLDRALVSRITFSQRDRAIVESTLKLAVELGMNVVAEGIEENDTLELLAELACPTAQGHLMGRPQAHDDLLASVGAASMMH